MAERTHTVASLPGDGIGPEVVAEARKAVDAAAARFGFGLDWIDYDLGADRYLRTGEVLPDTVLKELGEVDAILLGAVGRPDVAPGVLERGLLLKLRFALDLYINLRPVRLYPGVPSVLAGKGPEDVDMLVVRENTEGPYVGAGGTAHRGTAAEVATETALNSRAGVERCVRFAASMASERDGRLTMVHKTNVLTHSGAAIAGGLGTAASANLNPVGGSGGLKSEAPTTATRGQAEPSVSPPVNRGGAGGSGRTGPSLFEPVHGSAPDIAGTGRANPIAAVLSAGLMLDHLGEHQAASALEQAVIAVLPGAAGYSTQEIGDQIAVAVPREVSA